MTGASRYLEAREPFWQCVPHAGGHESAAARPTDVRAVLSVRPPTTRRYSKNESHTQLSDYAAYTHLVHATGAPAPPEFKPATHVLAFSHVQRGRPTAAAVYRDVLMTVTGAANAAEADARAPPALAAAVRALAGVVSRVAPVWPVLSEQVTILAKASPSV